MVRADFDEADPNGSFRGKTLAVFEEIAISGGSGYNYALVPLLELLGAKPMTQVEYDKAVAANHGSALYPVLTMLFDRVDELLNAPIKNVLGMLANLCYALGTGSVATIVENLIAPVNNVIAAVDEKFNYVPDSEMIFDVDTLILSVCLVPYNVILEDIGTKMSSTRGAYVDENYQTSVDGIFACGNALHVHDLVDFVSEESTLAGIAASKYLKGQLNNEAEITLTKNGNGISYIVPQQYRLENIEDKIAFKFRVRKPYHKVKVIIKADGQEIKTLIKPHMLPAEMETIKLDKKVLVSAKELTFEVKED
jgi:hypothetical protein